LFNHYANPDFQNVTEKIKDFSSAANLGISMARLVKANSPSKYVKTLGLALNGINSFQCRHSDEAQNVSIILLHDGYKMLLVNC
jgi:uncharacterized heparinase superfamily protein